jgi:hypothetical protein
MWMPETKGEKSFFPLARLQNRSYIFFKAQCRAAYSANGAKDAIMTTTTNNTVSVSAVSPIDAFFASVAAIGTSLLPVSKEMIVNFVKTHEGFEVSPTALNRELKRIAPQKRVAEPGDLAYPENGGRPPHVYLLTAEMLQNMCQLDEKRAYGERTKAPKMLRDYNISKASYWTQENDISMRFNGPTHGLESLGWRQVWASPECLDASGEWFETSAKAAEYAGIFKTKTFTCEDGSTFDDELKAINYAEDMRKNAEVEQKLASGEVTLSRAALIAQLRAQFGDLPDAVLEFMLQKQDSSQDASEESATA